MYLGSATVGASSLSGPYLRSEERLAQQSILNQIGQPGDIAASAQTGVSARRRSFVEGAVSLQINGSGQSIVPGVNRTLKI